MRHLAMFAVLAASAVAQASVPIPPSDGPMTMAEVDVPQNFGPQQVVVQTREFVGRSDSGWHVHSGIEIATIPAGELELHTAAGVLRLEAGDSFTMPRGVAHKGFNAGTEPASLVVTLVVDKGKPLRTAVGTPKR